jgi:hypothetical protein
VIVELRNHAKNESTLKEYIRIVDTCQGDNPGQIEHLLNMLDISDSKSCPSQYMELMLHCISSINSLVHCVTVQTINCSVRVFALLT